MGSKRDRFKKLNQDRAEESHAPENETKPVTIVDELAENYDRHESVADSVPKNPAVDKSASKAPLQEPKTKSIPSKEVAPSSPVVNKKSSEDTTFIKVIDKSNVGRPKILQGIYKPISARLKLENYEHARLVGGKYGGMNGYINYLIEQDMKKNS